MAAKFSEKIEGPGTHCRTEFNAVSIPYLYFPWYNDERTLRYYTGDE